MTKLLKQRKAKKPNRVRGQQGRTQQWCLWPAAGTTKPGKQAASNCTDNWNKFDSAAKTTERTRQRKLLISPTLGTEPESLLGKELIFKPWNHTSVTNNVLLYLLQNQNHVKAVIRHLPHSTPAEDIYDGLMKLGFDVIPVKEMITNRG
jgi:hypothetical protein